MDPRELLARLNPTNVRFDVGQGGGVPELTNIDIAGALGMVPAGLGRSLMEYAAKHEGDRSRRDAKVLGALIRVMAMTEWKRRLDASSEARVNWGLAEVLWDEGEDAMARARRLGALKAKVALARDALWPDELGARVDAMVPALLCEFCGGGRKTNEEMAQALGLKSESGYRKVWAQVYEYLIGVMRQEEEVAARKFKRAVSGRAGQSDWISPTKVA